MNLTRALARAREDGLEDEFRAFLHRFFGITAAVLVVDMANFTRDTERSGIVHEMLAIHDFERVAAPIIGQHGGRRVKTDADAIFALFAEVAQAGAAGHEILAATIGSAAVGFGAILDFGDEIMGSEVNKAAKAQQRHAQHGVVELTEAAAKAAGRSFQAPRSAS
jgi:class 3 adenylate cyclase